MMYRDRIVTKIHKSSWSATHSAPSSTPSASGTSGTQRDGSILAQYAPKTVDVPRAHPVKVGSMSSQE